MTSPFELSHALRALNQDIPPERDLWNGIEQALDQVPRMHTSRARQTPWLLAAGLAAVTVLAVGLTPLTGNRGSASIAASPAHGWQPNDPRLKGAAIELAAAQMELRLALQQAPSSIALQRLLMQTRQQQSRLRDLERQRS